MSRHGRILVAMSGGVDSSVTAALLHEEGYDVVGVTMKTWDHASAGTAPASGGGAQSGCCSVDDIHDARAVAASLGVPHAVVDIRPEFGQHVVERFTRDYLGGRTPNPCVLCNTHIKWAALLERADALGCEWIATGHYARLREAGGRHVVSRGLDRAKDQSYVLWGVAQAHLARSRFPVGGFEKPEIRRLAAELGYRRVAEKKDSYEICFVPDDDYRRFLRHRVPGLEAAVAGGPFVDWATGETVGRHRGAPFYTVGQRRGLELGDAPGRAGEPRYVVAIDAATNTVTVGPREALGGRALRADGAVWGAAPGLDGERRVTAQIRAHDRGAPALAAQTGPDAFAVTFETPHPAIAPGQAVVLYDGDDVVAGGWIAEATREAPHTDAFQALPLL